MDNLPAWWNSDKPWIIADCLDVMKSMPDKCVDLVIADPPYFKIKDSDWDNQWAKKHDFIKWLTEICKEIKRVMKDNGSFYIFGDEKMIAYIQVELDKEFTLLNNLVWFKPNNLSIKYTFNLRTYPPASERILFYGLQDTTGLKAVHDDKDCFAVIKAYMRTGRKQVMELKGFKTFAEFDKFINAWTNTSSVVSRHYFADSQWTFPTKEIYERLQELGTWPMSYETLRNDYETLRNDYETLRRPFNPQYGVYDVISSPIINEGENTEHPTTKPSKLIETLVIASSNPGDIVFDPFLGSGTTLAACRKTGRIGLGCEINPEYEAIIEKRSMQKISKLDYFQDTPYSQAEAATGTLAVANAAAGHNKRTSGSPAGSTQTSAEASDVRIPVMSNRGLGTDGGVQDG